MSEWFDDWTRGTVGVQKRSRRVEGKRPELDKSLPPKRKSE